MQHIIAALVKDLAEQLRPMVAEMVRQELANADGEKDLEGIAQNINLSELVEHINLANLAGELRDSQLTIIAGDIDLSDLASEIDPDKLTENLDIDEAIRDFFQNNTFSIRS
jgi:hypothetical protein